MKTLLRISLSLALLASTLGFQPGMVTPAAAQLPVASTSCTAWIAVSVSATLNPDGSITRTTVWRRSCTSIQPDGNGGSITTTWTEEKVTVEHIPSPTSPDEDAEEAEAEGDVDAGVAHG